MIIKTEILDQDKNISLILKKVEIMQRIIAKAGAAADVFKDKISSLLSNQYYDNVEFIKFAKSIGINQEFNNAEE